MGRLQTARLENFIRRWGSIKGPGSVLSETLGDVFPILDLENLTPESQLTAGWHSFMTFGTVLGGVAQLGALQMVNVANSGAILVLDQVIVRCVAAQAVTFGITAPFTAGVNSRNRDTRSPNAFEGRAILGFSSNVIAGTGGSIGCRAGIDRELAFPNGVAVLAPGTAFTFVMSTTNETMTATFLGRIRTAEPSELSF